MMIVLFATLFFQIATSLYVPAPGVQESAIIKYFEWRTDIVLSESELEPDSQYLPLQDYSVDELLSLCDSSEMLDVDEFAERFRSTLASVIKQYLLTSGGEDEYVVFEELFGEYTLSEGQIRDHYYAPLEKALSGTLRTWFSDERSVLGKYFRWQTSHILEQYSGGGSPSTELDAGLLSGIFSTPELAVLIMAARHFQNTRDPLLMTLRDVVALVNGELRRAFVLTQDADGFTCVFPAATATEAQVNRMYLEPLNVAASELVTASAGEKISALTKYIAWQTDKVFPGMSPPSIAIVWADYSPLEMLSLLLIAWGSSDPQFVSDTQGLIEAALAIRSVNPHVDATLTARYYSNPLRVIALTITGPRH